MKTKLWVLTPEQAEKFFQTSIMKEAVRREEKEAILDEMTKNNETLMSDTYNIAPEEFIKEMSKHTKVLHTKKREK